MVISHEDRESALKIVMIYTRIHSELEKIETDVSQLNARKDSLLINLEDTRSHEKELIDKIKASNPDQEFNVLDLVKAL